jgi:hypothetical protein
MSSLFNEAGVGVHGTGTLWTVGKGKVPPRRGEWLGRRQEGSALQARPLHRRLLYNSSVYFNPCFFFSISTCTSTGEARIVRAALDLFLPLLRPPLQSLSQRGGGYVSQIFLWRRITSHFDSPSLIDLEDLCTSPAFSSFAIPVHLSLLRSRPFLFVFASFLWYFCGAR